MKKKQFSVRLEKSRAQRIEEMADNAGISTNRIFEILVDKLWSNETEEKKSWDSGVQEFAGLSEKIARLDDRVFQQTEIIESTPRHLRSLVVRIDEILRRPSFLEYRARRQVEGADRNLKGTPLEKLIARARAYFELYGLWPHPKDEETFGSFPADARKSQWPERPYD